MHDGTNCRLQVPGYVDFINSLVELNSAEVGYRNRISRIEQAMSKLGSNELRLLYLDLREGRYRDHWDYASVALGCNFTTSLGALDLLTKLAKKRLLQAELANLAYQYERFIVSKILKSRPQNRIRCQRIDYVFYCSDFRAWAVTTPGEDFNCFESHVIQKLSNYDWAATGLQTPKIRVKLAFAEYDVTVQVEYSYDTLREVNDQAPTPVRI